MSEKTTPVDSTRLKSKEYVVVVQCDQVVHEVCPGMLCEHAFTARADGFARYPKEQALRYNAISCGGCPGRPTLRKLMNLKNNLKKREGKAADAIIVHLSSCITRENHHGPRCPHIDYIKNQVAEAGLDCVEDSRLSPTAEKRRKEGVYAVHDGQ
jgi:predicted metal-binding protein